MAVDVMTVNRWVDEPKVPSVAVHRYRFFSIVLVTIGFLYVNNPTVGRFIFLPTDAISRFQHLGSRPVFQVLAIANVDGTLRMHRVAEANIKPF